MKVRVTGHHHPDSIGNRMAISFANVIEHVDKKICIENLEERDITDLKIGIDFYIDGKKHYDYEEIGDFNCTKQTVLRAYGGAFDGIKWRGDYLTNNGEQPGAEILEIINIDDRDMDSIRVHVDFKINGQWYYDYEDLDDFNAIYELQLKADGGHNTGSRWEGDFLQVK